MSGWSKETVGAGGVVESRRGGEAAAAGVTGLVAGSQGGQWPG